MKKSIFVAGYMLLVAGSFAQSVTQKLQKAFQQFENDSQLKHAISSLYVINAKTGRVVFDKNSQIGLAPASTQKIITSVTAFELLGKDYQYKTVFGHKGEIKNGSLKGDLFVVGSGDPTFGSWRYDSTKDSVIFHTYYKGLNKAGINKVEGIVRCDLSRFSAQIIPDGWIWQDIGNYYGAPADAVNWKENQIELMLNSGSKIGDSVKIISEWNVTTKNELKSAAKGTGDNAYMYLWNGRDWVIAGGTRRRWPVSSRGCGPTSCRWRA